MTPSFPSLTASPQDARSVCRDLVSTDQHDRINPFRSVVMLLRDHDYLRETILATAAVHKVSLQRCHGQPYSQELIDALAAKGRAYRLLRQALNNLDAINTPVVMIAVVFFINFDLIDTGRGNWKTHIEAAGSLITSISRFRTQMPPSVAQIADVVVADCVTYYALGSLFSRPNDNAMSTFKSIDMLSTLQRAAAFSYGCSPPLVLAVLAKAGNLSPDDVSNAAALLAQLCTLDARAWVYAIEGLHGDLELRVSMANAHRSAACLYIVHAVPRVLDVSEPSMTAESLLHEILQHLASVPIEHSLAKGVTWPTFIAGAQAVDASSRQWCFDRLHAVWRYTPWACPWGFIESAMEMLRGIWRKADEKLSDGQAALNWLQEVRGMADHCLIV